MSNPYLDPPKWFAANHAVYKRGGATHTRIRCEAARGTSRDADLPAVAMFRSPPGVEHLKLALPELQDMKTQAALERAVALSRKLCSAPIDPLTARPPTIPISRGSRDHQVDG